MRKYTRGISALIRFIVMVAVWFLPVHFVSRQFPAGWAANEAFRVSSFPFILFPLIGWLSLISLVLIGMNVLWILEWTGIVYPFLSERKSFSSWLESMAYFPKGIVTTLVDAWKQDGKDRSGFFVAVTVIFAICSAVLGIVTYICFMFFV